MSSKIFLPPKSSKNFPSSHYSHFWKILSPHYEGWEEEGGSDYEELIVQKVP